jgi:ATP-dependent Clp protease ATP-binding subunit ClpX
LYNNKFFKVAEFKNNAINYKDEEIIFTNYDVSKISNINYILPTKEKTQEKDKNDIKINMKELYFAIKENVIGQDETIKQIVSTIDRNYNITNFRNKTNILLIGPSGSGKTEIFRTIANNINIPITIEDSEQYSAVGYKGANIEDMLIKLYNKANKNLELAERGILVVDEIDKKVSKDKDDVSGTRVLNAFLSLMEGTTFRINVGTENNPEYVNFNTEFLTVVLAGAFSDMTIKEKGLGFNNKLEMQKEYKDISLDDLNKYGLSNETLRRVSICRLNNLTLDNLIDIMLKSKNSALFEYYKYAEKKKIKLIITDEAIKEIASIAIKKNVGASGIKDTLNEILNDAIFEVEMNEGIYSSIKITKESLSTKPPYQLIKKNDK